MNPEDNKIDAMVEQATLALQTETIRRLLTACATDALIHRIAGPEYEAIAGTVTGHAIIEAANREYDDLDDTEREQLATAATDHVQARVAAAIKHAWVVCEALDADPTTIPPDTIAFIAAMHVIPPDATHPNS